ncbi:hypothetical protein [Pseudoalteromonas aurantia]|uniref:Uncharacterized protein n=1 Tax=Pseudoalteromonas aurantia 208 TaxID=1314867 RepID=A0ABR9EC15_9GAMM|nr:hypothetical protein [Pseudoalteromonas aurantia]MBE0368297.1 hypothetical protein [Pseudoalteromonas aurantia 208]
MLNQHVMARPKKALSKKLQAISTMCAISCEMHMPLSGYAFEKYFEPENFKESKRTGKTYRSDKYDRFIKNGVSPTGKSLSRIKEKCPHAYQHYCSPFWLAIEEKQRTQNQWQEFYLQLDESVKSLVFEFLWHGKILDGRVKQENMPLIKLIRIGNDHAIAALIGLLLQQCNQDACAFEYIETQLYNVIFNFLSYFFPYNIQLTIYAYLYNQILNKPQERIRESPWPDNLEDVAYMLQIENKNLLLAEDLGLVWSCEQGREFYFWKMMGDRREIVKEMSLAHRHGQWKLTDHPKGLKWLIKKLNTTRPKSEKLSTEYVYRYG